jgi:hypothetical protein
VIQFDRRVARARARLLANYNDIDVFVEDVAAANVYVRLINRVIGKNVVSSVIALGSRQAVLDACAGDQTTRPRRRLYVIDGDLDLLLGRPKRRLRFLYRLKVYSLENLVATEWAAVHIGQEALPTQSFAQTQAALQIDAVFSLFEATLIPLYVLYATSHKVAPSLQTIAYPLQRLLDNQGDPLTLSRTRVRDRMREMLRLLKGLGVSRDRYRKTKASIRRRLVEHSANRLGFLSGKQCLLPAVQLQLRKVAGMQSNATSLMVRLAQHVELDIDPGFARAVKRTLRIG